MTDKTTKQAAEEGPYTISPTGWDQKFWKIHGPTETGSGDGFSEEYNARRCAGYLNAAFRAGQASQSAPSPSTGQLTEETTKAIMSHVNDAMDNRLYERFENDPEGWCKLFDKINNRLSATQIDEQRQG